MPGHLLRSIGLVAMFAAGGLAGELFKDDFSRFPPRIFSEPVKQLTNAIHEYHYLAHRGVPTDPWANALIHLDVWTGGDEDGKPYLEQHVINEMPQYINPLMITGDPEWQDYTLEVKVRPLSYGDMAGAVFRYRTNRHYYLFDVTGGKTARLRMHVPTDPSWRVAAWREIASAPFRYDTRRYCAMKVENRGPRMRCYIDGKLVIEASDSEILKGKIGVTANIPARFTDVRVTAPDEAEQRIKERISQREAELSRLRAGNPKPKLWKKFDTPGFGTGRNVRFGDLDGDGKIDMLMAQHVRKVVKNAFDQITCLTAVNMDGKILWQTGRADPYNDVLANDTPFQIHDLDGDGKNEVIVVKDFKIQVLEGKTGKLRQWAWMPEAPPSKERPYEYETGDAILFLSISGKPGRREMLIKDRKKHFWVYNNDLQLIWHGQATTGHYPFARDVDGDGREEIFIGYSMWSPDGRLLWNRDKDIKDHSDAVILGNYTGNPNEPILAYSAASDEGLVLFDLKGNILKHHRYGHAQSGSIAKYRPDLQGLQMMTVNFWRSTGIINVLDAKGNILAQGEPIHHASPLLPVNWRGDGQEFAMLSGNWREGGLVDGHLRRVVMLPNDGHPDLAFNVLDLTGDPRDEIVVWDSKSVWVYTQEGPFGGRKMYVPTRNAQYNESNYRIVESVPNWKEWPTP